MIALLLACVADPKPPASAPQDSAPVEQSDDSPVDSPTDSPTDSPPDEDGLRGQALDPPLAAPSFLLQNQRGEARDATYLDGAPTVLWFFRDTANSCTNDGCGYRDLQDEFDALGVRIVAVGPTTPTENLHWAQSLDYSYEIWSDPEGVMPVYYEAESTFDEGALRHAFILDAEGQARVRHEGSVSLGADPLAVLEDCRTLFGVD